MRSPPAPPGDMHPIGVTSAGSIATGSSGSGTSGSTSSSGSTGSGSTGSGSASGSSGTSADGGSGSSGSSGGVTHAVDVFWHFSDGQTCAGLAGRVAQVRLSIPGQMLPNQGFFPCDLSGVQGLQSEGYAPGSYSVAIEAVDARGAALYSGSAPFTIAGADAMVDVTLFPSGPDAGGALQLRWSFAVDGGGGQGCAAVQVSQVALSLDGAAQTLPCTAQGIDGADLSPVTPGNHALVLSAQSAGPGRYGASASVDVASGSPTELDVVLQPQ